MDFPKYYRRFFLLLQKTRIWWFIIEIIFYLKKVIFKLLAIENFYYRLINHIYERKNTTKANAIYIQTKQARSTSMLLKDRLLFLWFIYWTTKNMQRVIIIDIKTSRWRVQPIMSLGKDIALRMKFHSESALMVHEGKLDSTFSVSEITLWEYDTV